MAGGGPPPLDGIANLTGAGSFSRKLLTSYTGAYYDDVVGTVVTLFGQIPGRSMQALNPGSTPTISTAGPYNRPCALCNGAQGLRSAGNLFGDPDWLVSNIISQDNGYIVCSVIVDALSLDSADSWSNHPVLADRGNNNMGVFLKKGPLARFYTFAGGDVHADVPFSLGIPCVFAWRHVGGLVQGRINGGPWTVQTAGTSDVINTFLEFFKLSSGGGQGTTGKIFEWASCSTPPSDSVQDALEANFLKWAGKVLKVVYDDFAVADGTLLRGHRTPTGQDWQATGPGYLMAEIQDNHYVSADNTYAYLPYNSQPIFRIEGEFSWLPVEGSALDRVDTTVCLIGDAAPSIDGVLQTMTHMELRADGWSFKTRVAGGLFIGVESGVHNLATDGTEHPIAIEFYPGFAKLFLPDGSIQDVESAAIGTTIKPVGAVWQITTPEVPGAPSFQKRWKLPAISIAA